MAVRILTWDELPSASEVEVAALDATEGDPPMDRRATRRARRLGHPFAEYVGVFAVDGDHVLSRVGVLRREVQTDLGPVPFGGITSVVTRPEAGRQGLARRLFRAAHARERAQGRHWAMLWTYRSWGAHRLYERLGYRDLYSSPVAVRPPTRGRGPMLPRGYHCRPAIATDARLLERLFARSTVGRVGFRVRPPGAFAVRFAMGWRPPSDHWVLREGTRPVGYAYVPRGPRHANVQEVVVVDESHRPALLRMLERLSAERWLMFTHTSAVLDLRPMLAERGFTIWPTSHSVLMGRPLTTNRARENAAVMQVFADPRFTCQRGDVF